MSMWVINCPCKLLSLRVCVRVGFFPCEQLSVWVFFVWAFMTVVISLCGFFVWAFVLWAFVRLPCLLTATGVVKWSLLVPNNRIHPPGLHLITDWDPPPKISYNLNISRKMGNAQPDISVCADKKPPLWSSAKSSWLQIPRSRVRFPALPDFQISSVSGTGYIQPHEQFEELLEWKVVAPGLENRKLRSEGYIIWWHESIKYSESVRMNGSVFIHGERQTDKFTHRLRVSAGTWVQMPIARIDLCVGSFNGTQNTQVTEIVTLISADASSAFCYHCLSFLRHLFTRTLSVAEFISGMFECVPTSSIIVTAIFYASWTDHKVQILCDSNEKSIHSGVSGQWAEWPRDSTSDWEIGQAREQAISEKWEGETVWVGGEARECASEKGSVYMTVIKNVRMCGRPR
jgi:hypothetical protein